MDFLDKYCTFKPFTSDILSLCNKFDCNNEDLNDFFTNDCVNYSSELMGKTYCFTLDSNPSDVVCIFTISNDSIKTHLLPNSIKNRINRKIPNQKRLNSYPAALIGRLGVGKSYQKKGVGKELMNFIKSWFINPNNKTGCRYLVVDSYNEKKPIDYYTKNGFQFLFKDEKDEKKYTGFKRCEPLKTRLMYFDLIVLRN